MDRLQILKDYVEQREEKKRLNLIVYQTYFKDFIPDIKEVIELHTFMYHHKLPHFVDDNNPNRHKVVFNYIGTFHIIEMRRFTPAYCQDYKFRINEKGEYTLIDLDGDTIKLTHDAEIDNLQVFCEEFPKYRDRFFEYVESFQTKEV